MFQWNLRTVLTLILLTAAPTVNAQTPDGLAMESSSGYQLGKGFDLPLFGLRGGGYVNIAFTDLKNHDWRIGPHDLSLFLYRDFATRWHFFSELELGEPFSLSSSGISTSNADFDIERIYVDYRLASRASLRFGKFLTPIGRWNLIHADPLIWTVSRPLTTAVPFSRHAAGLMGPGPWERRTWTTVSLPMIANCLIRRSATNWPILTSSMTAMNKTSSITPSASASCTARSMNDCR